MSVIHDYITVSYVIMYNATQAGFNAVLSYDPSLSVLAYCLDNPSTKVKVLVLKVSTKKIQFIGDDVTI